LPLIVLQKERAQSICSCSYLRHRANQPLYEKISKTLFNCGFDYVFFNYKPRQPSFWTYCPLSMFHCSSDNIGSLMMDVNMFESLICNFSRNHNWLIMIPTFQETIALSCTCLGSGLKKKKIACRKKIMPPSILKTQNFVQKSSLFYFHFLSRVAFYPEFNIWCLFPLSIFLLVFFLSFLLWTWHRFITYRIFCLYRQL